MRSRDDIFNMIELQLSYLLKENKQRYWEDVEFFHGYIEALEWVIGGEDLLEKDKKDAPEKIQDRLLQVLEDSLQRPVPFYTYLKDKEKEK